MSTYWDLYCRTCNVGGPFHWNHGDGQLVDVLSMLPALKALNEAYQRTGSPLLEIEVRVIGPETQQGLLDFASAHAGHDVAVKSEYGEFYDRCPERYTCACGRSIACTKLPGHSGEHGPEEPHK